MKRTKMHSNWVTLRVPFPFREQKNTINEMHYTQYRKTICWINKVNVSELTIGKIKKLQDTRKERIDVFSWWFTNKNCHYQPHKFWTLLLPIILHLSCILVCTLCSFKNYETQNFWLLIYRNPLIHTRTCSKVFHYVIFEKSPFIPDALYFCAFLIR